MTVFRVGYAVEDPDRLPVVAEAAAAVLPHVSRYADWLQRFDERMQLPRSIVFTDLGAATRVLSTLPLPAWTNTDSRLVVVDPIPADWSEIFIGAIPPEIPSAVASVVAGYYESLGPMDVASIVGHELTHHLTAFDPDAASTDRFEEGFCFYLARSQMLDAERLAAVSEAEAMMLDAGAHGPSRHLGGAFGVSAGESVAEVLVDYWRATRTVTQLAQAAGDQGRALLDQYRTWWSQPTGAPFLEAGSPWDGDASVQGEGA